MRQAFVLLLCLAIATNGDRFVKASSDKLVLTGCSHIEYGPDGSAVMHRLDSSLFLDPEFLFERKRAETQSGIALRFSTNSAHLSLSINHNPGGMQRKATFWFGVFCDGEYLCDIPGDRPSFSAPSQGMHDYEIVFPIMYQTDLKGIILDKGSRLRRPGKSRRNLYFAIGDSITHGTGQRDHGSQQTYAWQMANACGLELYNLAVGGSCISKGICRELEGRKAELITVLWGYNDWMQTKGDLECIRSRFNDFMQELVRVQPDARIVVILPTPSREESYEGFGCSLGDVRDTEEEIALSLGRPGIIIVRGDELVSPEDLSDKVHLSNQGASVLARALKERLD
ncbi:MAG: SGNH/GDSL hydrolase family protein [Bacteroidales bacterium]|nr:SGNH/GDSL hydrolase family protein [Candidatus Cryptobacteroides aphodequi]